MIIHDELMCAFSERASVNVNRHVVVAGDRERRIAVLNPEGCMAGIVFEHFPDVPILPAVNAGRAINPYRLPKMDVSELRIFGNARSNHDRVLSEAEFSPFEK